MAALRQRRSDLKRQVRDAAKEERNLAKKRQRLMQAGEPGTKGKLSISVANDFGRPPRICRLVTCSSCCSVPTSKALMVDLCSDVLRIMDFERMRLCLHLLVVPKCDVIPRLETFQALNDTGTLLQETLLDQARELVLTQAKSGFLVPVDLMFQRVNQALKG